MAPRLPPSPRGATAAPDLHGGRRMHRSRTLAATALAVISLAVIAAPSAVHAAGPTPIAGCPVLPADSIWNVRVDSLPRDPKSDAYVNGRGLGAGLSLRHDFGSVYAGAPFGMPYVIVP